MDNNRETGKNGEDAAAIFLIERNFIILERNYRCGRAGEMDIIAQKENLVIFVEVKSRSTPLYGGALFSISGKKKKSLRFIAHHFINRWHFPDHTIFRFDLIAIEQGNILWARDILR
ncbi:MAG: YraN family protein [Spirochaetae bacterium HGW-Spirochaetae-1]|jgi:putative endonuclease|nr:MAG: YraN family protein [Spirochaetae bacterium HGW-Spirochaetae-1]